MYVPASFALTEPAEMNSVIRRHSFALLIAIQNGEPFATHVPLILHADEGPHGTLYGHVARANPHARLLDGCRALAVFSGPHAYISPTWYETPGTVPTWNYVAVHAAGTAEIMHDEVAVLGLLSELVNIYESGMPQPWSFNPTDEFVRKMLDGIVGFRIPIDRLEGKAKLNQNHPPERRDRVASALLQSNNADSLAIAGLMQHGTHG